MAPKNKLLYYARLRNILGGGIRQESVISLRWLHRWGGPPSILSNCIPIMYEYKKPSRHPLYISSFEGDDILWLSRPHGFEAPNLLILIWRSMVLPYGWRGYLQPHPFLRVRVLLTLCI